MVLSIVQVIGNVAVGGAERHLLDLVDGLGTYGDRVQAICPRRGPLSDALTERGVRVDFVEMALPRANDDYALSSAVVDHLTQCFRVWQPDVVHSHLYPAHLHASIAAVQAGVPVVVHTAHSLVVRRHDGVLGRLPGLRSIATSRAVARLLTQAGIPAERLAVIYNGVGPEHVRNVEVEAVRAARSELKLSSGPLVGTVARLSPEKGVDVLLRALALVVGRVGEIVGLVVGDGPQAAALQQLALELGLCDRVHFPGARHDIPLLNRLLDVFVLPSREEACPIALLEAMAAGRAVIATRVGGSSELIADGVDGLLVEPDDPPAMADAIGTLLAHDARRAALGLAARRKVEAHFTREQMVRATRAWYARRRSEEPVSSSTHTC
jgi:glycosyltransferase involved in cell wall biosynthesis